MSFCVREHIKPGLVEDIKHRKKFPEADMTAELFYLIYRVNKALSD